MASGPGKKQIHHAKPMVFMSAGVLDDVYLLENQAGEDASESAEHKSNFRVQACGRSPAV